MNITLFDELESKIKVLADELKAAREGAGSSGPENSGDGANRLKQVESKIEQLIHYLDELEESHG